MNALGTRRWMTTTTGVLGTVALLPSTGINSFSPAALVVLAGRSCSGSSPASLLRLSSSTSNWRDNNGGSSSSEDSGIDSNTWQESSSNMDNNVDDNAYDWEEIIEKRQNGSFWSEFHLEEEQDNSSKLPNSDDNDDDERQLEILASLQAEEVEFNLREANRADMVRQMQEWGFEPATIASTLDVAVVEDRQQEEQVVKGMQSYREASYIDTLDDDLTTIESHTKVPKDPDTNEPLRSRMVYVDEHSCIGCTNCAMIAQSTFFMEEENGRARVFEQWGDDENTIQIAIDTCPVDCIHYVSYEDLVQLEVKRRDQSINVLAGLVSRAERGASGMMSTSSLSPRSFGNKVFTDPPTKILQQAVNYGAPGDQSAEVFQTKEKIRLQNAAMQQLEQKRRQEKKIADL